MTDSAVLPEKDILATILSLLVKQQRLSENTSKLVESMVSDVGKFREQSERLAIVSNKLDTLEKTVTDYDRRRADCIQQVTEQFRQSELKREANKDRTVALEQALSSQIASLKIEMDGKLRAQEKDLIKMMEEKHDETIEVMTTIREKIATLAGKYGAIVAGVVSIGMMILKWIIDHHNAALK